MNLKFKILVLVGLLQCVHPVPIQIENQDDSDLQDPFLEYKLPKALKPDVYFLNLEVDLDHVDDEEAFFTGTIVTHLKANDDAKFVQLNKDANMKILTKKLINDAVPDKDLLSDADVDEAKDYNSTTNILTLNLKPGETIVNDNTYTLTLGFKGRHRDDMNGFYRSSYVNSDGKKRWLLTTQFESVAARSAFPCWDEPSFKAHYTISIVVGTKFVEEDKYHALSNTPLKETKKMGDKTTFIFDTTTKKISSYLIAFIVSDFKHSANPASFHGNKPFLTWGQAKYMDKEDQLSQIAGPAALDVMYDKTGIEFGYPKVDQVGIPDFSAGAMENWGLTTYRERMLFFDDSSNSIATQQSIVGVITHELAHQWFGDLVTLHFWDDIWLNEGFADFFEYHAANDIVVDGLLNTSTWNYLGQFVTDELQSSAFETDGLPSSRPLTSAVGPPDLIEANFDNIAYAKGGSVIRMWMHVLGEKLFYDALHNYLMAHREDNSTPRDLLKAFNDVYQNSDNKPSMPDGVNDVATVFEDWHKQAGYPVLNVQSMAGTNTTYNITQERFLWKVDPIGPKDAYEWFVPISWTSSNACQFNDTQPSKWLKKKDHVELEVQDSTGKAPAWIVLNIKETGYYRVNYEEANWMALAEQLQTNNETCIHEINRAQIIDDSLALSRSTQKKYLDYSIPLEITKYLAIEKKYVPWAAASNGFNFLNTKLASDANYEHFKTHILNGVKPRYEELGLAVKGEDSHEDRLLRILIANWACKLGHKSCVDDALKQYKAKSVQPDVKSIVYCTALRNDDTLWDEVWETYSETDSNIDQTILLSALGCTKNEEKLNKYLLETINATGMIRSQDLTAAFSAVYSGNPENVNVAIKFLNDHLDDIAGTYGGMNPIGKLITGLANRVVDDKDRDDFNKVLDAITNSGNSIVAKASTSVGLARDTLESTKDWLEDKKDTISKWLSETYGDNSGTNPDQPGGGGGAGEITVSIITIVTCLAFLFSS